jgi:hypothetical protein
MKIRCASLLSISLFILSPLYAQRSTQHTLEWRGGVHGQAPTAPGRESSAMAPTPIAGVAVPPLELVGAQFDEERGNLPFRTERMDLPEGVVDIRAVLQDEVVAEVAEGALANAPYLEHIGASFQVWTRVGSYRKRPIGFVNVVPLRRNAVTGRYERLVSYRIDVEHVQGLSMRGGERDYPASSKLASGEWYRMTVPREGVYRLTYEQLASRGLDAEVASDRINVYGSHFGLLPFTNAPDRPTDLLVNAIEVEDGGDGNFGPGDHLLFYASGPHTWSVDNGRFVHTYNTYSDSASYFVGIDVEAPVRVAAAATTTDPATAVVTSFSDRHFHEREQANLLKSGRLWLGELFDLTTSYNFSFNTPFLVTGADATLVVNVVGRTYGLSNSSSFTVTSSGGLQQTITVQGVSQVNTSPLARAASATYTYSPSGSAVPVSLSFTKFDPVTSVGWLNYLELNCRRELRMTGDQLLFRDLASQGPGQVLEWVLAQAQNVHRVWDVTDPLQPRNVALEESGNDRRFRMSGELLREFVAFRNTNYPSPTVVARVPNQDLHATANPVDLVIVSPPEFTAQAARLAERRSSEGLNVVLVSPQQIYNEFSSGARDATAIKRFMRMLYDRAGNDPLLMPRHLLLFGDGSYNNLSQAGSNQNFIPTYQSAESIDPRRCYVSDDYFGLLDPSEGESTADLLDIGVGRLPISTTAQATEVVNKLLSYDRFQLSTATGSVCAASGSGGIPDWRTHVLFASDDQEGDIFEGVIHMEQSDRLARRIETEHPRFNVDKVYMDAYQQVVTPGGERYSQANTDLRDKVQKGLLLVNYVGHGGEVGWAHERFLDNGTISAWTNADGLPLFVTATCEFTRWDDPGRTSAGELVLLNPGGGGIGLMTTARLAFSGQNFNLAQSFYDHVFEETDDLGREAQLGDVFRETKAYMSTNFGSQTNHRHFVLIGDPSMRLAMPRARISVTEVTDTLGTPIDTMKALATVRIKGFVDNGSGQPMADFNGVVLPTVFDKEADQSTLANDGGSPFEFKARKSTIYRGRATVREGRFELTFVVPGDINYQVGTGRVSCYAENGVLNAVGYDNSVLVGDAASDVAEDAQGPEIDLFMNDENFVSGGVTDGSPLLFAKLFDENGINTVGSSIGHDLLAVVDENTEQAIVLNDLYEADLDTYRSGQVRYRLSDLAEGEHTLRLKAWDTHNNSADRTVEFVVTNSAEIALERVLNYPNPFTTRTSFYFEHNRPCNTLDVQVQVFTVSGRLIKTLGRQLACEGYRSEGLEWDGRDDFGDRIGRGVYVYRLSVRTPDGEQAEKFEKLVILR